MTSLADVFPRVAVKELAKVDLPHGSHQHELNGVQSLREFFGTGERVHETLTFHLYRDGQDPEHENTEITFYDSRENVSHRSAEWRLYYTGEFLARASPGDTIILARARDKSLHAFVLAQDSAWLAAGRVLFGLTEQQSKFYVVPEPQLTAARLELAKRRILEELGIELVVPQSSDYVSVARSLLKKHDGSFPSTLLMSEAARELVHVDLSDVDRTLYSWLDAEEQLFYAMEDHLLMDRVAAGFKSVDAFVEVAQSTLQRRKARMGHSLQHHAAKVFAIGKLSFTPQAHTERKNRPDFLFPGEAAYHDAGFSAERLTMLAAKSTCKDRWRQVLTEADRISNKHLLTLDQALSADQVREMSEHSVQVVLPAPLQASYPQQIRKQFLTLADFVEYVRIRS